VLSFSVAFYFPSVQARSGVIADWGKFEDTAFDKQTA
jgi:hypothetical protein